MDALEIQVVIASADGRAAAVLDLAPAVADGADGAVKTIKGILCADQHVWAGQHFGSDGQLCEVVARLWVDQCRTADTKASGLENAATDGDVALRFGHVAGLQVDAWLEFQVGNGGFVSGNRLQISRLLRINIERRQRRGLFCLSEGRQ